MSLIWLQYDWPWIPPPSHTPQAALLPLHLASDSFLLRSDSKPFLDHQAQGPPALTLESHVT